MYDENIKNFLQNKAETGDAIAQCSFAIALEDEGKIDDAILWYKKSISQGYSEAEFLLAKLYSDNSFKKGSPLEVIELYEKASNSGHLLAPYHLAEMYFNGIGVEKNVEKSLEWYVLSATKGYDLAQSALGNIYLNGSEGVEKNYHQAFRWIKKASNNGLIVAMNLLGAMYIQGLGCDINYDKAEELFEKTLSYGNKDAEGLLKSIKELKKNKSKEKNFFQKIAGIFK